MRCGPRDAVMACVGALRSERAGVGVQRLARRAEESGAGWDFIAGHQAGWTDADQVPGRLVGRRTGAGGGHRDRRGLLRCRCRGAFHASVRGRRAYRRDRELGHGVEQPGASDPARLRHVARRAEVDREPRSLSDHRSQLDHSGRRNRAGVCGRDDCVGFRVGARAGTARSDAVGCGRARGSAARRRDRSRPVADAFRVRSRHHRARDPPRQHGAHGGRRDAGGIRISDQPSHVDPVPSGSKPARTQGGPGDPCLRPARGGCDSRKRACGADDDCAADGVGVPRHT